MSLYIYEQPNWTDFVWDKEAVLLKLMSLRHKQGKLMGKMQMLGFDLQQEALLETLTLDVLKSTEIEGEFLNLGQVRSSIARRLGMSILGLVPSDRHVDGVVEMMLDATQHYDTPLSINRLFDWHAALFPTGRSGMYRITVGDWRKDEKGAMQVVSGSFSKEKVHFQAPAAAFLDNEMTHFIEWFNQKDALDATVKAAIAHLWFITIHPFDDGNGRIARAITDMQLAKAEGTTQRFYSMSAQIQLQRNKYYDILEHTQKRKSDISDWLFWFLDCLNAALNSTELTLNTVLYKATFWQIHAKTTFNERQKLLINKLLDGFEGKLTSSKWAKIAKCSTDTALRDIQDLIQKDVLIKELEGGRSTNYELKIT
jgi:Fic family protein